jgi:hypothetical protein
MALQQLNTTELDFDKIKANIKQHFLRQDSAYTDWNFEGSSLNLMLDVLAYNTHYNAILAHMAVNESFIDSAQIRKNVVSHAKLVGYTPRSARSARAEIKFNLGINSNLDKYSISRGQNFTSQLDEVTYNFICLSDNIGENIGPGSVSSTYEFKDVVIYEGILKVSSYRVNNALSMQKFVIDETNVDISSLNVRVRDHTNSANYLVYTAYGSGNYKTLEDLTDNSYVFFIYENVYGKYEISFGNGIFGKRLDNLNIVELEYILTSGSAANYINDFKMSGYETVITTTKIAGGGDEKEDIESVRFNAPISIITQNRAVTANDYQSLIMREYSDIQTMNVWGGENHVPPEYGKVFISIKPKTAEQITDVQKTDILKTLLEKKVVTITPIFIDVDFTYIYMDVFFKFNSNLSRESQTELETIVRKSIKIFNISQLESFDNVFRYSNLLKTVDNSNIAILNSFAQIYLYKKMTVYAGEAMAVVLDFNATVYAKHSLASSIISTDEFIYNAQKAQFSDEAIAGDSVNRNIYMHYSGSPAFKILTSVGNLNIVTGLVNIYPIDSDEDIAIRIYIEPNSYDLAPERNQLLTIDHDSSTVTGEADTIAISGTAGIANYRTFAKN